MKKTNNKTAKSKQNQKSDINLEASELRNYLAQMSDEDIISFIREHEELLADLQLRVNEEAVIRKQEELLEKQFKGVWEGRENPWESPVTIN